MKCPHCQKETKAKVIESRRVAGQVWRQRLCGACLQTFISTEVTSADLRFPWVQIEKRKRRAKKAAPSKTSADFSALTVWNTHV